MARYCIGDVHGNHTALDRLLDRVAADAAARPDSRAAIEAARTLERRLPGVRPVVLRGNHEDALLAAYDGDAGAAADWLPERHGAGGGLATLRSYVPAGPAPRMLLPPAS